MSTERGRTGDRSIWLVHEGEHRERKNRRQKHLASAHDGTADARPVLISAMYIGAEEFCRLAASIEDVRMISARG